MSEERYICYICSKELTEENKSDEHIILNAIGGHLHSYTLLCKECNSKLGERADAKLAEDLSFYTDILQVRKNRNNPHSQIMKDQEDREYVVKDAGARYQLRKPIWEVVKKGNRIHVRMATQNMEQLKGLLNRQVKVGALTEEQVQKVLDSAKMEQHKPILSKSTSITEESFPSIVKSAVNYYVYLFQNTKTTAHLVPFIKGEKNCRNILYLYLFKELPYETDASQVTHMIHLEGHKDTRLLYALMEYFSLYTYVVVLDSDYQGEEINETYTYDVISGKEINRGFSLKLAIKDLETYRNQSHDEQVRYFPYFQKLADNILAIWERRQRMAIIKEVLDETFKNHHDELIMTEELVNEISQRIADKLMDG